MNGSLRHGNADHMLHQTHRARLLALIAAQPGRTLEEHETSAEKVTDRLLIRNGLPTLLSGRQIRRDEDGRLWPLA
ncbi:hypothetical protein ABZ357_21360 [Streptomyces sp. NPDC005917]|uniref:hypothetical protein n=1 Tax=unclassified Streptomyces TaxID=2593676 RepID=UPI0033C79F3E